MSTPIFPSVGGASDQGGLFAGFTPAIDAQTENRRGLIQIPRRWLRVKRKRLHQPLKEVALAPLHPLFGDPSKVSAPIFPSGGWTGDQGDRFAGFNSCDWSLYGES